MHGSTKEIACGSHAYCWERCAQGIATVAFAFLTMLYISQFPAFTARQMNADALFPADFTWDVLHHSYAWSQYQLPRVPSIFPDLLVYGLLQIALGGYGWAMFAFAVAMFLGLSYVCGWFAALLSKRDFFSAVFISEGILSVLFIADVATPAISGWGAKTTCLRCNFLYPTYHGGPLLAALAAVGLICLLLERRRESETVVLYVALYFIATLTILSDRLTWVEFLVPASVALGLVGTFFSSTRMQVFSLISMLAASFFTAHFLELHINHDRFPLYYPAYFFAELSDLAPGFWKTSVIFFQEHMLSLVFILIPTAFFCAYPIDVIAQKQKNMENLPRSMFIWLYMSLAAAISCVTMIVLYAVERSIASYRYDQLLFFMGVPFITATALRSKPISLGLRYFLPGAVALFACIHIGASTTLLPGSVTWRPKYADCLDALRVRLGVQAGLATYWNARLLTLASNWKVQVLAGYAIDASPRLWENDPLSYRTSFVGPYLARTPRFILMDGFDSLGVSKYYGKPDSITPCDSSEIWMYNDPGRFYADLKKRLFWPDPPKRRPPRP